MLKEELCLLRNRLLTLVAIALFGTQAVLTCNLGFCTTLGAPDKELLAAINIYNKRQYRQAFASFAALAQKTGRRKCSILSRALLLPIR